MNLILSLLMVGAIAMIVAAIGVWRRGGARRQVWLMLIAAAVMLANVAILAVPLPDAATPAGGADLAR